ncbi:hypothetical protein [Helicobacter sp. 23-1045]
MLYANSTTPKFYILEIKRGNLKYFVKFSISSQILRRSKFAESNIDCHDFAKQNLAMTIFLDFSLRSQILRI